MIFFRHPKSVADTKPAAVKLAEDKIMNGPMNKNLIIIERSTTSIKAESLRDPAFKENILLVNKIKSDVNGKN